MSSKVREIQEMLVSNDTTVIEVVDLHPNEMWLLKALRRNWRHGEVTILMRDGVPYRLRRVTEFIDLQDGF